MKILLINPRIPVYKRVPSVPLGLLSIASYLNANGHEAVIVERAVSNDSPEKKVNEFQPDVIGISAMSFLSSKDAKDVTLRLRKITSVPIIWGGQAACGMPELMFEEAMPDYIMDGEGELTWLDVADTLARGGRIKEIEGLMYMHNGQLVRNPARAVADLSTFPDIDWSLVEPTQYFSSFFNCSKMLYLYASKGCPAHCTFCSNSHFHQSKNRCRLASQVVRDIEYLSKNCGMDGVYFSDELFCPRREIRTELCNMLIEKNLGVVWGCQMRLGVLNEADVRLMYQAGCRWILFGIESGNPDRIEKIKKNTDISIARDTIKMCEDAGITVQASFIIGFPDETEEEMRRTVSFANSISADLTSMNILAPLPNSEITQELECNGTFRYPDSIRRCGKIESAVSDSVIINLSRVPDIDLKVVHYTFQWKCFASKDSVKHDSFGIIKKMASDTFNRIFMHGFKGFVFGTVSSAKQFLTVFFYSHFFPAIRKKYNI